MGNLHPQQNRNLIMKTNIKKTLFLVAVLAVFLAFKTWQSHQQPASPELSLTAPQTQNIHHNTQEREQKATEERKQRNQQPNRYPNTIQENHTNTTQDSHLNNADQVLKHAYENQQSNIQIEGVGRVKKILADDLKGSRHQRFILELSTGQTLLIAHNIDLAPKIDLLQTGDTVAFYGEYEWTKQGGVIHWTHHDPRREHISGWLKHNNRIYH